MKHEMNRFFSLLILSLMVLPLGLFGCPSGPAGLIESQPADTTVLLDFTHRPLPEIPLPIDLATRYDETSPTGRRINISKVAPTRMEGRVRELLGNLDGWGVFQPLIIPFTGPLDVQSILDSHRDPHYNFEDDILYLVNIDPNSKNYGKVHPLDIGNGNYPVVLEQMDRYWPYDPRGGNNTLLFEEADEDRNQNGIFDPGEDLNGNGILDDGEDKDGNGQLDLPEDTDADGVFDRPNYLPGVGTPETLTERAEAIMSFYERETHTLIARPMTPLDERTRYAIIVSRRLKDEAGNPVGSPYPWAHHAEQTEDLKPLLDVLPPGCTTSDIAFTFSFTTQSVHSEWSAVRDGLYGHGVQRHLAEEFPAQLEEALPMRETVRNGVTIDRVHLLPGEDWAAMLYQLSPILGYEADDYALEVLIGQQSYVDYFIIGSFFSPQLFDREDADGNRLPYDAQSWPADISRKKAEARSERIYFTLAVPRKEVSARGQGEPAPVVIMGHGYTGNRFDVMQSGGLFAQHGLALLGIDGPSHGLGLAELEEALVMVEFSAEGLEPAAMALLADRAVDLNADGIKDSGADFWTSYLFHTRDMVRQFALDYTQLIRIFRTFDGVTNNTFTLPGATEAGLAGDFDNDGIVDVGGPNVTYGMTGGSLGGMMSMIMGSIEPAMDAVVPFAGGGGLSNIGVRSVQGGVSEGFILRGMGPLYLGEITDEGLEVKTIVAEHNDQEDRILGYLSGAQQGDTIIVENMDNGERGCAYLLPDIADPTKTVFRTSVESDFGDQTRILLYAGPALVHQNSECAVKAGKEPVATLDAFHADITLAGAEFLAGSPLLALQEGLGLKRGTPGFRRFQGLGQLVLDPADPAVLSTSMQLNPWTYPGTGEQTGAHALVIHAIGDMNVPASSAMTFARSAGILEYLEDDPRFDLPMNQVMIDYHVAEAVHTLDRARDEEGNPVHLDVENLSGGDDFWGPTYPRLGTPLRAGIGSVDPLGGESALLFPLTNPEGAHGFDFPGVMTDRWRDRCRADCAEMGDDPCGCETYLPTYDIGLYLFHMMAHYIEVEGSFVRTDACQGNNSCGDIATPPAARSTAEIP